MFKWSQKKNRIGNKQETTCPKFGAKILRFLSLNSSKENNVTEKSKSSYTLYCEHTVYLNLIGPEHGCTRFSKASFYSNKVNTSLSKNFTKLSLPFVLSLIIFATLNLNLFIYSNNKWPLKIVNYSLPFQSCYTTLSLNSKQQPYPMPLKLIFYSCTWPLEINKFNSNSFAQSVKIEVQSLVHTYFFLQTISDRARFDKLTLPFSFTRPVLTSLTATALHKASKFRVFANDTFPPSSLKTPIR